MEAIVTFIASFAGATLGLFLFSILKNNPTAMYPLKNQVPSRSLHALKNRLNPPRGVVLHSLDPEEERKEKYKEWEQKAFGAKLEKQKENISQDLRK